MQKKHFYRKYSDNVALDNSVKKKTSSYFNIKVEEKSEGLKLSTSLYGVGLNDFSTSSKSGRPCIKLYPDRLLLKRNLI